MRNLPVQYHATTPERARLILEHGLKLPTPETARTNCHQIPSISTADSPMDAAVYAPHGVMLVFQVGPRANYIVRSSRSMRKNENLQEAVNRWLLEAASRGTAGVYMKGWQNTVGNQHLDPASLRLIEWYEIGDESRCVACAKVVDPEDHEWCDHCDRAICPDCTEVPADRGPHLCPSCHRTI